MNSSLHPFFVPFYEQLPSLDLAPWRTDLPKIISKGLNPQRYGDLPAWLNSTKQMPRVAASTIELQSQVRIGGDDDVDTATREKIELHLRELIPWRKGPWWIHNVHINTEWRSDWKWDRVAPHLDPLDDRLVLDVGCGNGYHAWRMLGAGAKRVIGIDPSPRFVMQFYASKQFADGCQFDHWPIDVLPTTLEELPELLPVFDSVFSMGVLYHRPSPMDHLRQLKACLKPGGQLLLETLVIDGQLGHVLVPEGRYAMMNNVWFIPSPDTLISWLRKCGFRDPRLIDANQTSTEEQRATDWMQFHSLANFLDPNNSNMTVEGHPAPLRASFTAYAP